MIHTSLFLRLVKTKGTVLIENIRTVLLSGNSRYLFLHASVAYAGSIQDSRVLQLSDIYQKIEHENLLPAPLREISGFLIIGDCAFQNRSWIIKPYANHAVLMSTEHRFNTKLCGVRGIVERAFGLLKSRW